MKYLVDRGLVPASIHRHVSTARKVLCFLLARTAIQAELRPQLAASRAWLSTLGTQLSQTSGLFGAQPCEAEPALPTAAAVHRMVERVQLFAADACASTNTTAKLHSAAVASRCALFHVYFDDQRVLCMLLVVTASDGGGHGGM